ncbi:MAG: hypothetical protein HRT35_34115, partial [Algicola sp.]|nr:hypothetical protein [Algicola sp.]
MSDFLKHAFVPGEAHSSNITPEFISRFSSALILDDFQLQGKEMESWNSLGFSDLQKSLAIGKSGRGFTPQSFSYESGKIHQSSANRYLHNQPGNLPSNPEELTESSVAENDSFSLGTDSFSTEKKINEIQQKSTTIDKGRANQDSASSTEALTSRAEELAGYFHQQDELAKKQADEVDSTQRFAYDRQRHNKSGPDYSESQQRYEKLKSKYAVLSSSVPEALYQRVLQDNHNIRDEMAHLQQQSAELNAKEQQLVKQILDKSQSVLHSNTVDKQSEIAAQSRYNLHQTSPFTLSKLGGDAGFGAASGENEANYSQPARLDIDGSGAYIAKNAAVLAQQNAQTIDKLMSHQHDGELLNNQSFGILLLGFLQSSPISPNASAQLTKAVSACLSLSRQMAGQGTKSRLNLTTENPSGNTADTPIAALVGTAAAKLDETSAVHSDKTPAAPSS